MYIYLYIHTYIYTCIHIYLYVYIIYIHMLTLALSARLCPGRGEYHHGICSSRPGGWLRSFGWDACRTVAPRCALPLKNRVYILYIYI